MAAEAPDLSLIRYLRCQDDFSFMPGSVEPTVRLRNYSITDASMRPTAFYDNDTSDCLAFFLSEVGDDGATPTGSDALAGKKLYLHGDVWSWRRNTASTATAMPIHSFNYFPVYKWCVYVLSFTCLMKFLSVNYSFMSLWIDSVCHFCIITLLTFGNKVTFLEHSFVVNWMSINQI
jgi:hypothetical protein